MPRAEIQIVAEQRHATVRLSTSGLTASNRAELVLGSVPTVLEPLGRAIVQIVADYVIDKPIADGETMATPHEAGALVVRLVREGVASQRIVDAFDASDSVPWIALTTMICWSAHAAAFAG